MYNVLAQEASPTIMYSLRFLLSFFNVKSCLFHSSYTISSIIVAYETRLTENGIPPSDVRLVVLSSRKPIPVFWSFCSPDP